MRKPSSNSVRIRSIDREAVDRAVRDYAARLRRDHPEIRRVIWFGSWVSGLPSPGSDVDLCIVVSEVMADVPSRERTARYLMPQLPLGLDLVVYTESEFQSLVDRAPAWHAAIQAGAHV